jgi:hypothetical protein
MKLLFENWRKYLNEDWDDEIADIVADTDQREKAAKTGAQSWKPTAGSADWEKFKKWKEKDLQPLEQPGDFEKAVKQKSSQKKEDILKFNCEAMKDKIFGGHPIGGGAVEFDCQSLANATQGIKPGEGSPSQIFKNSKFKKEIGSGAYGVAVLFDNNHIVKFFKGGVGAGKDPLLSELEGYEKLLSSQLAGTAKSYDLAVYEFGRIPIQTYKWVHRRNPPGADKVPDDGPPQYVGYAEIGKVIPFGNWVKDKYNEDTAREISEFIWDDLAMGLDDARRQGMVKTFDEIGGDAEKYIDYIMNGDSLQSRLTSLGIEAVPPIDPHAKTEPGIGHAATNKARGPRGADRSSWPTRSSKPDSATLAGRVAKRRADRQPRETAEGWPGIANHGLTNVSQHAQKYGWAADKDDYFDQPAIPPALSYGLGKDFLHSLLASVYRAAKLNNDDYLYGNATSDVHEGNFGISYQTGEVIIFDR